MKENKAFKQVELKTLKGADSPAPD